MSSACLIRIGKTIIGAAGSWQGIDDPLGHATARRRNESAPVSLESKVLLRSCVVSWDRPFDQPVCLPDGSAARTLRDAANYIKKLPKSERHRQEWRLAIHMLIDTAEHCGPLMFARMGMLRAFERDAEPRLEKERRQTKCARRLRKLARDR